MKAALLTRYDRAGASSRLRMLQYAVALHAQSLHPEVCPFFDDDYLGRLYSGQPVLGAVIKAYGRRIGQLSRTRGCDVVWLEKEALPWAPWAVERLLLRHRGALVVDYDDAVFHRYDMHRSALVRGLLGRKLDHLMASAALITAGNRYLADHAIAAGARNVEIVPTVVDLAAYSVKPAAALPASPAIGWIGSPSTWAEYVRPMLPLLLQISQDEEARLLSVGAGHGADLHPLLAHRDWSEATEVAQIHAMDIGIMPLSDTPWARGKCGYKLIQYMACGLPVIASPVGVNVDIVEHGINGFLASTDAEWASALRTLIQNPDLRTQMGSAGRRKIERAYSLQSWGPRVAKMLHSLASKGRYQG